MATAYLRTDCDHCQGSIEYPSELAGQSTECPHCQQATALPSPFVPTPAPPPPPQAAPASDIIYFSGNGITVTHTRFVAGGQIFALANVSSVGVQEHSPNRIPSIVFLLFGSLLCLGRLYFPGAFIILAAIAWLATQKPTYSVALTAAGGEVQAYTSKDKDYVVLLVKAVNDAIIARG